MSVGKGYKKGRPKKYTPEYIDKEAVALDAWSEKEGNVFLERFCLERGYSDDHLHLWAKERDSFSRALKKLILKQRVYLKEKGLSEKGNAMAMFLLKCNHGMVEKQYVITEDASDARNRIKDVSRTEQGKKLIEDFTDKLIELSDEDGS